MKRKQRKKIKKIMKKLGKFYDELIELSDNEHLVDENPRLDRAAVEVDNAAVTLHCILHPPLKEKS